MLKAKFNFGPVVVCAALLVVSARSRADSRQLGALAARLPVAPLSLIVPSLSRAARRLRPLFERVGNALPDWHPQRMFVDMRVRLGLDFFDPQSLRNAGIDPTGPLYILDDGRMLQPLYVMRLLPGGARLLADTLVPRVRSREQLQYAQQRTKNGLLARSWALSRDADPRLAYLVDGELLLLAPQGCARDFNALFALLRAGKKKLRLTQSLPAQLKTAPLYLLAGQHALRDSSWSGLRLRADDIKQFAMSLDVIDDRAVLDALIRPSARGRANLRSLQPMGTIKVRRLGALSMWWRGDLRAQFGANRRITYLENLRQWYAQAGLDLAATLQKISGGQVGLHLLDVEAQLPGLSEMSRVSERDKPFFLTQAWRFPVQDLPAVAALQHKTETMLKSRPGHLSCAAQKCRYAGAGRVTDFGLVHAAGGGELLQVVTGPQSWQQVQKKMQTPLRSPDPRALIYVRANAMQIRSLLGRVSLLSAGKNNSLRAVWMVNQWLRPGLRGFGEMSAQLLKDKKGLRLQAWADLRDMGRAGASRSFGAAPAQKFVPGGF